MTDKTMDISIACSRKECTHFHSEIELCYVMDGSAVITVEHRPCSLQKEDVLLVNSGAVHSVESKEGTILVFVHYACHLISELLGTNRFLFQCNSVQDQSRPYDELRKLLKKMVVQHVQQERKTDCIKRSSLYQILDCVIENFLIDHSNCLQNVLSDDEKTQYIVQYINQNYQLGVNMTALAGELSMSTSSLSRFFKKQTGLYFTNYVSRVRMHYVVQDLLKTDKGITKIAVDCGFSSLPTFNRVFQNTYGMTPSDYRTRGQEAERQREREEKMLTEQLCQELRERMAG